MLDINVSDEWRKAYPGSMVGLLEMAEVDQGIEAGVLALKKREIEKKLRERFEGYTRRDFLAMPVMAAYDRYYRRFGKTFHVLQQLESIALKGRTLPDVNPLVDAAFMAEVDTLVLTAGHDVGQLYPPVWMDIGRAGDEFVQMNGTQKGILAGDMLMRDERGVCCSVIYGQDNISPISKYTGHVLYMAYVPEGVAVELVETHLQRVRDTILLFSPGAMVQQEGIVLT